jgi:hypothetical protein
MILPCIGENSKRKEVKPVKSKKLKVKEKKTGRARKTGKEVKGEKAN